MLSSYSSRIFLLAIVIATGSVAAIGQGAAPSKLRYFDHDGTTLSNNEFVDIRMANPSYPDATIVKTMPDGATEFRLQKIPQEGMPAPDFAVKTLDGKTVKLADLRGKVVVLNFWFIGCPVCRALKPKLNAFKSKFGEDGDVVFIAMTHDPESDVEKYLKREPFDYLQVTDARPTLLKFAFRGFPKNIVIDKQGNIAYWRTTIAAWDKFESVVRTERAKN